jgi:UDP-N-acetylmuramate--alanine ligase
VAEPQRPARPVALDRPRTIHLVGVGGAGISAIGVILATMGHRVSGVDVRKTPAWGSLRDAGVRAEVVPEDRLFDITGRAGVDLVAHSSAFRPDPAAVEAIEATGAAVTDRAGILAAICAARSTVAVSGTHGKTSTTAMLATLLEGVGADPSYLVGATPVTLARAAHWGGPAGSFVVEADESDGSFEVLGAGTAVVTNVEEDHLEHWGSIDAIEAAFDRFLDRAATRVVCVDRPDGTGRADERAVRLATRHRAVTVGEAPEARYRIHHVEVSRLNTSFGLEVDGLEVGPVSIGTPGRHHARNAATAIATAATMGVEPSAAVRSVASYQGVARRFQVVGEASGVTVVDDYAHNPGKVGALIASAKEAGWGRVVVVFQPHRYTRTEAQGDDLGRALAQADLVAVTEVYAAGEAEIPGVSGRRLADLARAGGAEAAWTPTLAEAADWVLAQARTDDLVLTVGAGDVHRIGPEVLERLAGAAG